MTYVTSPETVRNSTIWLQRVSQHMQSERVPDRTEVDTEYLSRFHYTRTCGDSGEVETWDEWIEPITITARHPFGFGRCKDPHRKEYSQYFTSTVPRTGRSDVDYVLLQTGSSLHRHSHTAAGKRVVYSDSEHTALNRGKRGSGSGGNNNKHYLFDAGTSTFDSSLFWFTCGYSQRRVSFDEVFGWEMTILEPRDYWRRVPALWKPHWHFFNTPISSGISDADSPLRFIQQLASPADFVSFKLDIDHPAMEMPIALSLLTNPAITALVDEFFFELHFQCEVMTSCGWGKKVPRESHGLLLDRPHVLQFFIDLRKKGIRAHIWP